LFECGSREYCTMSISLCSYNYFALFVVSRVPTKITDGDIPLFEPIRNDRVGSVYLQMESDGTITMSQIDVT